MLGILRRIFAVNATRWNPELWPDSTPMQGALLRRPTHMPRPFWSRVAWVRIPCWAMYVSGFSVVVTSGSSPTFATIGLFVGLGLIFGAWLVWSIFPSTAKRRMVKRLEECDYRLCLTCGYRLEDLPLKHVCPECGSTFDIEQVRAAWRHWVQRNRVPQSVSV